jgi:hypothetical protein
MHLYGIAPKIQIFECFLGKNSLPPNPFLYQAILGLVDKQVLKVEIR